MKKITSILLVLMLVLTACSSKETTKTEEELRTEIRVELEAEAKQKEEQKEQEESRENVFILDGILMSNEPPLGTGIKLNKSIEITRQWNNKSYTFDSVYFSGDEIYNYVDRDKFIYNEPFILLSDDSVIPVKIKFDFSEFVKAEGVIEDGHIWTDQYEILEVNGSSELVDKSNEPYPFSVPKESSDIKDKDALLDIIYTTYEVVAERTYLKENMETQYVDFTGDGKDDVMCFLNDVTKGFYKVAFISADKGTLELIPFEGDDIKPVSHLAYYDGKFIHYMFEHAGYGMSGKINGIYVFDGSKIKETGALIELENKSAQPPSDNYPEGYETETTSTITFDKTEDDFTSFVHDTVTTGSREYQIKKHYVYNEGKMEFDVETLIDTSKDNDNNTNENNNASFYDAANIKVGQNIGGLKVSEVDYTKGHELILELNGNIDTKGVITGYYNEMYSENEFIFTPTSKIIDKPINYTINANNTITNFKGVCSVDGLLDEQTQNYILEGNELSVDATITSYKSREKAETEAGQSVSITNCQIIADENYVGYIEGGNGKKPSLENETFTTTNQGDLYLDYAKYKCVIIPMHDTVNSSKADTVTVDFSDDNTTKLKFTVFGEIQDVKINYVANMGEEGEWKDLGIISNSTVEISASLPNDMSTIIVYGKYHEGEGYYKEIKFTLDDMRDLTAYDIIVFE